VNDFAMRGRQPATRFNTRKQR